MLNALDSRSDRMARGGLSLSLLMSSLDTSIANASLPLLAAAFGASFQQAQWIVLAYLLAVTSLAVGAGRLGDLIGRRTLLLTGIALFTATSVVCAAAPTWWVLVVARTVQGIWAAIMTALAIAVVGDVVPRANAGRAMGQLAAMSAIGTTIGPAVASALHGYHPGFIFLVNVPLGAVAFALLRRHLPIARPVAHDEEAFDVTGTFLLTLTLATYSLSMTLGHGRWTTLNIELLAASVCAAIAFFAAEAHARFPLVSVAIIRDRPLSISLAANAVVSTVVMATLIVGPYYLSRGLALGATAVGVVLSIGPAAAAMTGTFAGRAVERFGSLRTGIFGLGAMLVGAAILAVLPLSSGVAGYVGPVITLTSGYAMFQTANNTGVMAATNDKRRGVVAGLLGLSRNLGLITGASAMGAVFLHAAGGGDPAAAQPELVAAGMRFTLGVAAFLVASVVVFIVRESFVVPQPSVTP